jgi:hypothetical protein
MFGTSKLVVIGSVVCLLSIGCSGENKTESKTEPKPQTEVKKDPKEPIIEEKDTVVLEKTDAAFVKRNLKFKGKPVDFIKWKDVDGIHYVVTSETELIEKEDEYGEMSFNKDLTAYHYLETNGQYKEVWKISDNIRACPVDVTLNFIKKTLQVTDLNQNGIAEVWTMYRSACRGDVSPCTLYIIMYEGKQKYLMEGNARSKLPESPPEGGNIYRKVGFKKGDAFIDFANTMWKRNVDETF